MKKHIILISSILISNISYSQVGIDTDEPKATLDIKASPLNEKKIDGLIAPRLTGNQLKANDGKYGADQIGAIIYATAAASPTTDKTINVTNAGYYYFDGTVWVSIKNSSTVNYQEPWNVAGGNVPATLNTQNIYQMGRVGIGTSSPSVPLHLNTTNVGNNNIISLMTSPNMAVGDQTYLKIGKSDSGNSDLADIKYNYQNNATTSYLGFGFSGGTTKMALLGNGYLGIGTTAPTNTLHVVSTSDPLKLGGLQTVTSFDKILAIDTDGVVKSVAAANISPEPWYNVATNTGATANTQNIYQMGAVSIGKNAVYSSAVSGSNLVQLDTAGAVRFGNTQRGSVGINSIATGLNNEASGANSSSFGKNNTISGSASIGAGDNNSVTGDNSITVGNKTSVTGNNSAAFGANTVAGNYAFAANDGAKATGRASVALTRESTASGENSVAIGYGAEAQGQNSISIGYFSKAISPNSFNLGTNLIGGNSSLNPGGVVTLGKNNLAVNSNDAVFVVGGGADSGNRQNLMYSLGYGTSGGPFTVIHPGTSGGRKNITIGGTSYLIDIQLEGNVWGKAYFTDSNRYADYVFEDYFDGHSTLDPAYKFKSLYEVEKFIIENRHLPGVTSINSLSKNDEGEVSFNLSDLSLQSLEKIEELYLHTIELQKQVDKQKIQIEALIQLTERLQNK